MDEFRKNQLVTHIGAFFLYIQFISQQKTKNIQTTRNKILQEEKKFKYDKQGQRDDFLRRLIKPVDTKT